MASSRVADDNPVNCEVLKAMLEVLGCSVDVVIGGEQAIQAVERQSYAVVLMDCQMPVVDGYEATRRIRLHEGQGKRVPIIAVTAHAMTGEREKTLAAGMDDYLTKPVALAKLTEMLWLWLPRGRLCGRCCGTGARKSDREVRPVGFTVMICSSPLTGDG